MIFTVIIKFLIENVIFIFGYISNGNLFPEPLSLKEEEMYFKLYKNGDEDAKKVLSVTLKYSGTERVISGIKRISKPGLRVYAQAGDLPKVLNGLGIAIISTSKGLMCDKEARKIGAGGEVLAYVW